MFHLHHRIIVCVSTGASADVDMDYFKVESGTPSETPLHRKDFGFKDDIFAWA